MVPHFYVLCFGMEHWVLCNACGTGAIMSHLISEEEPSASICAPGSVYTHMIYEMSEISLTVLKCNSKFNHLYTHAGDSKVSNNGKQ
jgi:hypothetical protein